MKIGVCVKQVPAKDAPLAIVDGGAGFANPTSDLKRTSRIATRSKKRCASRKSTAAKSSRSRWVPSAPSKPSRKLSPRAPNAAFTLPTTQFYKLDPLASARSLAAAIGKENFDLILTGLQSDDQGFGQTGVLLAELLGRPARHDHHVDRSHRWPHEAEARTRSGLVSVGRAAAARGAHDPVRHQQAALRHA